LLFCPSESYLLLKHIRIIAQKLVVATQKVTENTHMAQTNIQRMNMLFIKRLVEERKKNNLSQLDLALSADLSKNLVNLIETGKRSPSLRTVFKLCDALNINPGELFIVKQEEKNEMKQEITKLINCYL